MKDRLKLLFEEQLKLNLHINPDFESISKSDPKIKRQWIQKICMALFSEVTELADTGKDYKWWGPQPEWSEELEHNLKIELIDLVFFTIMGMQVLGMDDNEMWDLYLKKKELNHKRQNEGYKEGTYVKVDADGKEDNFYLQDKKSIDYEKVVKQHYPHVFLDWGGEHNEFCVAIIQDNGKDVVLGSGKLKEDTWKNAYQNIKLVKGNI